MDNEAFTDLLAGLDDAAAQGDEAPASADVAPASDLDSSPTPSETVSSSENETAVASEQPVSSAPAPELPPPPQWDSPENPYFQQAQQLAQQQQAIQAQQQQWAEQQRQQQAWQYQQQQQARYQELDAKWREIAAGDLEAYDTIRASVAELTQPYLQQAQSLNAEMEHAKRLATATHIAATYGLTPQQQESLNANIRHFLQMQSPEQMLADVEYRRAVQQQQQGEVERLRRENEELRRFQDAQRQTAARQARGADVVGAAIGTAPAAADTFDTFDDLFNRVIGAA